MEPELKLKCRKNRSKLVNAMLKRDDNPCREVYKRRNCGIDQFCTLGLAFELVVKEFPDKFRWYKMCFQSFYPVSKINYKGKDGEFSTAPAHYAIEKWLGLSIESAVHIANENDNSEGVELVTWGHMAQVVLGCPYEELEEKWNSNSVG